ncbi:MAG: acyl-CoA dehydrogenase family protein [Candidatus Dormibacteria bacterium]
MVSTAPTTDALQPVLEVARKHASAVDRDGRFPQEAVTALRESGLLGLTAPTDLGGMGGGPAEFVETVSALAGCCGSTAMIYLMHVTALMPVLDSPPDGLPELGRELAGGRKLGSLALSEKGSRSHFWAPVSRQARDNGSVRLQADKSWVTSAGEADLIVSSCLVSEPGVNDSDLFAVPTSSDGVKVAGPWRGMGLRGNSSSPIALDTTVPYDYRLGKPGEGFRLMMEVILPWFNIGNAAVSLGLAQAACDAAVTHCTGARLEHLDQALADLPTIRAQLSKMHILLDVQTTYLRSVAASVAAPDELTPLRVLASKAAANEAALTITDTAMRVCGGAAFSQQLSIDRYFRDARAGFVMAPTADALYDFYGKAITGRPLF